MAISVMFDSNVYRKVLEANGELFTSIQNAIKDGKIQGFLSEVIFQIEAIQKIKRKDFFYGKQPSSSCIEKVDEKGNIKINICVYCNYPDFPQGSDKALQYLDIASSLGIKVIKNLRIGVPESIVPKEMFLCIDNEKDFHLKNNKTGEVSREIENMGCGIAHIRNLANKGESLHKILTDIVKSKDAKVVAKAFSEWADGDAIASCIGYGINYFCTEDCGKAAGKNSVCSPDNKAHLEKKFGIKFISAQDLLNIINADTNA